MNDEKTQTQHTMIRLSLTPPLDFCFREVLAYLSRSTEEILYRVDQTGVTRCVDLDGHAVLLEIRESKNGPMSVSVSEPSLKVSTPALRYVREWFDLDRDLQEFYRLSDADPLLRAVVRAHRGLRLVGVPDLFEALAWAVIGQQIHLRLAYTLKRRFVEAFGRRMRFDHTDYWLFPTAQRVAEAKKTDLIELRLTQRKVEYLQGIAEDIASGQLSKATLLEMSSHDARARLMQIRGVGEWTAHYTAMRCLLDITSFPVGDAGLQRAVKQQLGLATKPTLEELRAFGQRWSGWEAYATFYLWRSLEGNSA